MEKREELEIPIIKFTPVTLLGGASSCEEDPENDGTSRTQYGTGGPGSEATN